jgi:hypothetical protein
VSIQLLQFLLFEKLLESAFPGYEAIRETGRPRGRDVKRKACRNDQNPSGKLPRLFEGMCSLSGVFYHIDDITKINHIRGAAFFCRSECRVPSGTGNPERGKVSQVIAVAASIVEYRRLRIYDAVFDREPDRT